MLRDLSTAEPYIFPPVANPDLTTNSGIQVITLEPDGEGIISTGVPTDLAIHGAGWFVVQVPDSNQLLYTRTGSFRIDAAGRLITDDGCRVQGFSSPTASEIGDIIIDQRFVPATTHPAARMTDFSIQRDGTIQVKMSDGTEFTRAQVLLQDFRAPTELLRINNHLFASTPAALPTAPLAVPGTAGLGKIYSSSVDITPTAPQIKAPAPASPAPFLQGAMTRTANPTDVAIRGPGVFLVRDPVTWELFATRAGMFLVDSNNYLITYDRKRLQGLLPTGDTLGDLQVGAMIPRDASPEATAYGFWIDEVGAVTSYFTDGTSAKQGQILLYVFQQPEKLRPAGLGQFAGVNAAQPYRIPQEPRYGPGTSWLRAQALELINVPSDLLARRRQLSFFQQGALFQTDHPADLAIDGQGFFLLQDPVTGRQFATRNGHFELDADGFLVNAQGLRLQGYPSATESELGDLRINPDDLSPSPMVRFEFSRDGGIKAQFSNGTENLIGQILLLDFKEPFVLREFRGGLYRNVAAAQPRTLAVPGSFGLGSIQRSALESPVTPERLTLPARDGFRFLISGDSATRWIIQATDDWQHWRQIGVVTPDGF